MNQTMNEVLTDFVLDETGISLITGTAGYIKDALMGGGYDEASASMMAAEEWREEVLYAVALAIPDDQSGEYEIEFVPQCFAAGTPVATEAGLTPIERIHPGDRVWAWNAATKQAELRSVVQSFIHQRQEIETIALANDCFEVTAEHPFWVDSKGWVRAADLKVGDRLVTRSGGTRPIEALDQVPGEVLVYNFEVDTDHNYYVGNDEFLTHNAGAQVLRALKGIKSPLLAAHHIVSRFEGRFREAAEARQVLRGLGISLDSAVKGVALPRNLVAKSQLGSRAAAHAIIHTRTYYQNLVRELKAARALAGKRGVEIKLEQIGRRLKMNTFPY